MASDGSTGVSAEPHTTHVLVVEDDRDTREVVKLLLQMEGMQVSEAADGCEALDQLHTMRHADPQCPCVIVLDMMMPRCSGEEFRTRQLRDPRVADVPIIVLSAVADSRGVEVIQPFARLAKPFDADELVMLVRRACGMHD